MLKSFNNFPNIINHRPATNGTRNSRTASSQRRDGSESKRASQLSSSTGLGRSLRAESIKHITEQLIDD